MTIHSRIAAALLWLTACARGLPPATSPAHLRENTDEYFACMRERILRVPGREESLARLGRPSEASPQVQEQILGVANAWAHESGYLPCPEYQMAAALLHHSPGRTLVYIGPESCESLDWGWVPPAATLVVDHRSLTVVDSSMGHTGCAYRRNLPAE